jgi:hypothetical protein
MVMMITERRREGERVLRTEPLEPTYLPTYLPTHYYYYY